MNVKELREQLDQFDPETEVLVDEGRTSPVGASAPLGPTTPALTVLAGAGGEQRVLITTPATAEAIAEDQK